jgi:hypothetical protein
MVPTLVTQSAATELVELLCSASQEIGLKEQVCNSDNRPELLEWMKRQCEARRVWTLYESSTLLGMLILGVAELSRCRRLGPILVRHIQSLGAETLSAEARNDRSRRMLERCGFVVGDSSPRGFPVMRWHLASAA